MAPTSKKEARGPIATLRAWKSKAPNKRPAGFTLVEMLVVAVVLALLAAVVAMRWSGVHHGAVAESARTKLQFADQHLRQFARSRRRPATLAFDLQRHRLGKRRSPDESDAMPWESLGTGIRIEAVRVGVEKPTRRQIEIPVDANGQTPTYGIHLQGPGQREAWYVVAGVSGQLTELPNERSFHETFELLAPPGL